jgi:DNA polymerase III subunit epsilon
VFDRKLVAHALDSVQQRLQRGAATPSAQFVTTTRSGQLLRVQMAPVRGVRRRRGGGQPAPAINGFVLMLDNITARVRGGERARALLHGLTEGSRGSLANLQAAVEMLDDARPGARRCASASWAWCATRRGHEPAHQRAGRAERRGPGHALAAGGDAGRRLRAGGAAPHRGRHRAAHRRATRSTTALWLKLDSFSLLQALAYLALRLRDEFEVRAVQLR